MALFKGLVKEGNQVATLLVREHDVGIEVNGVTINKERLLALVSLLVFVKESESAGLALRANFTKSH